MKILEYTSTKLTLQQNAPRRHWIIGLIFILVGLVAIAGPEQVTTFKCERLNLNQGSCELIHYSLIKSDRQNFLLENIQEAKIETVYDSNSAGKYRLVLVTNSNEKIPFVSEFEAENKKQVEAMNQINKFLKTPNQLNLEIVKDERLFAYLFGGLFIGTGLISSGWMAQQTICNFDKTTGAVTLTKKGLLWKVSQKVSNSEVFGLHVETNKKKSAKNKYRISLVLTSGKKLNLGSKYELTRSETQKLIDCITTFLNVGVTNMW